MTAFTEKFTAIASDPTTDHRLLARLANLENPAIRRALAANPNTPSRFLVSLWHEYPLALLENPIFDLWDFSPAQTTERVTPTDSTLIRLHNALRASHSELPERFFGGERLVDLVSRCASLQEPAVFDLIPFDPDPRLRIALFPESPARDLFHFFDLHAPDPVWKTLAADPHPDVRLGLATLLRSAPSTANPARSVIAEAAFLLAGDPRPEMTLELAHCRFLPAELAEKFSHSPDPAVRAALAAANDPTPEKESSHPALRFLHPASHPSFTEAQWREIVADLFFKLRKDSFLLPRSPRGPKKSPPCCNPCDSC